MSTETCPYCDGAGCLPCRGRGTVGPSFRANRADPMSTETRDALRAEDVARLFHEAYERLAPSFGYETRRDSAVPWDQVPEQNRRLMVAVAGEVRAALRAMDAPLSHTWAGHIDCDPAECTVAKLARSGAPVAEGLREALCAHMEPHEAHDEPNPWRGLSDPFRCPGRALATPEPDAVAEGLREAWLAGWAAYKGDESWAWNQSDEAVREMADAYALRATDAPSGHSTHRDVDEACPECHRDASDDGLAPVRATDAPVAEGLHCEGCAGWVEPSYLARIDCPGIVLATPEPDA